MLFEAADPTRLGANYGPSSRYVLLHNPTSAPMDVSAYTLRIWDIQGGATIHHDVPLGSTPVPARGYLVVTRDEKTGDSDDFDAMFVGAGNTLHSSIVRVDHDFDTYISNGNAPLSGMQSGKQTLDLLLNGNRVDRLGTDMDKHVGMAPTHLPGWTARPRARL